jgi:hypothetical protein
MEKKKVKEVYYHGKCTIKEKRIVMVSFLSWQRGVQPPHPELAPARCAKYEVAEWARIREENFALSGQLHTAHCTERIADGGNPSNWGVPVVYTVLLFWQDSGRLIVLGRTKRRLPCHGCRNLLSWRMTQVHAKPSITRQSPNLLRRSCTQV